MKLTDKNIDAENARYWSALSDKELIEILTEICKKAETGKNQNQLNESATVVIGLVIVPLVLGLLTWGSVELSNRRTEKANAKLAATDRNTIVTNPDIYKFDHSEEKKVITEIFAPTGTKVDVVYRDPETREMSYGVADNLVKVDERIRTVITDVYKILQSIKGPSNVTQEDLEKTLAGLRDGSLIISAELPNGVENATLESFKGKARLETREAFLERTRFSEEDFKNASKLIWDETTRTFQVNGLKICSLAFDPNQETSNQAEQNSPAPGNSKEKPADPALADTSSSKWPWILGIAAAAVAVPYLWKRLTAVTEEVKKEKMLAKCQFKCTDNGQTYQFGYDLRNLQWTLSSPESQKKLGNEEARSFAKTSFAKKFADAVEVQMKNFYSESGSKPVYKAVEVAGKDKAKLIKLLYDNREQIENSLYSMKSCKTA